jgi:hypothetical protein
MMTHGGFLMRVRASLALLLVATGCTTTYSIPKTELSRLNGWAAQGTTESEHRDKPRDVRRLRDHEGREHLFSEDTPLVLVQRDGEVIAEKYVEVSVDGHSFHGVPQVAFHRTVEIPLNEVQSAGVREFSLSKTLLLGTGIVLGLTASLIAMGRAIGSLPERPPNDGPPCGDLGCEY